ncbi:unnamed protein product [Cuscuta campestris]|uniref:Uncharacterized protein n=1 Tax=Cuscuta campestris TaxID=132261 RepID=A0A484LL04_9ASTE|nr:unnamed protein product [Cuscuta campestris]
MPTGLFLSQQKHAHNILHCAKMADCNPVHTPIDTTGKFSIYAGELIKDPTTYRSLARALIYIREHAQRLSVARQGKDRSGE